jgi:1-acyl-sn-glycerol-3-phosphate acyltransferase
MTEPLPSTTPNRKTSIQPRASVLITRRIMQFLSKVAFWLLTDLTIEGEENIPEGGPLLVVGNHFSFADVAAFVRIMPWPMEFLGGFWGPHAPPFLLFIPRLWGVIRVYRGTGSRNALQEAERILKAGGVVAMYPEGGAWAEILRPARPGAAYLSSQSGAPLLPIGLDGLPEVFPALAKFRRAKVTIKIGKPFGPCEKTSRNREGREKIDAFSHEIMRQIAKLIPPEKGGLYSSDPAVREAAAGTEAYPWENIREGADQFEDYKAP